MLFQSVGLLIVLGFVQVQSYVSVPSAYRYAHASLDHYSSNKDYNPIIYSLLNILVNVKHSKAFISDEAIELSLQDVKKFDANDEAILRKFITSFNPLLKNDEPSPELKQKILSALDILFANFGFDDYDTLKFAEKMANNNI